MVPRMDMVCVYVDKPREENVHVMIEEEMTRYPLCIEDKDNIIGFVHVKDMLLAMIQGREVNLKTLARKVLMVPESMNVSLLLKTMQKEKSQLAIVVDEYGGTAGMVTIEDIIEEIVGEIQDEFDEERPQIEKQSELIYSIDARVLLEELDDELGIKIDDDNVSTLGGWLYNKIGGEPRVGQFVSYEGCSFFVEKMEGKRISRVSLRLSKSREDQQQ